jgi:2'-5' RNA ligase
VLDPDGCFAALREALAAPPFRPVEFAPHLTVIHPRTSSKAAEFWRAGSIRQASSQVTIDSIVVTSSEGAGYAVAARYPLG